MNLLPDEDQQAITSMIHNFLAESFPVRRYQDEHSSASALTDEQWQQLVELGWFGLAVPETEGGAGMTQTEELLLYRESGRQLLSPTALATSLAVAMCQRLQCDELSQRLISGETRAAFGLPTLDERGAPTAGPLQVFDGEGAEYVLLLSRAGAWLLYTQELGLDTTQTCIDETLSLSTCHLPELLPYKHLAGVEMADRAVLLLAAASVGIAEACLDMAVAYAQERNQFGQPIGSFQAIKHLCADMAVQSEAAWAQTIYACLQNLRGDLDADAAVAAAMVSARQAAFTCSRDNIQIHGGMSFTAECDAHFYLKRSHVYKELASPCYQERDALLA